MIPNEQRVADFVLKTPNHYIKLKKPEKAKFFSVAKIMANVLWLSIDQCWLVLQILIDEISTIEGKRD